MKSSFYSSSANVAEYELLIQRHVDSLNSAKFFQDGIEIFKRFGPLSELQKFDREQAPDEVTELLFNAVVIEVFVVNADAQFSVADFVQPDPGLWEGLEPPNINLVGFSGVPPAGEARKCTTLILNGAFMAGRLKQNLFSSNGEAVLSGIRERSTARERGSDGFRHWPEEHGWISPLYVPRNA